jgi:pimeloyl-ACP methyl ester carboxylesterase
MFARQCAAVHDFDALDRLPGIAAPTQVIAGGEDILTPPRYSEEIVAAIPGASYALLPDVGHGMFWEATDRFNETLVQFITESRP